MKRTPASDLSTDRIDHKVECLGRTFSSDEERRTYFTEKLREALEELHAKLGGVLFTSKHDVFEHLKSLTKWPVGDDDHIYRLVEEMLAHHIREPDKDLLELYKDVVGFPHGSIEDILRLSDPPYYTACPNPFINDFIRIYGKPYEPENDKYHREPYTADVSEGKNDPIYNAHSYHTKIPHKAIMRYILHYTEPGDIIFDGFCGTGMTGVAAQLCGDREAVQSLGYEVGEDGTIYKKERDDSGNVIWKPFSRLGPRYAILNDLSPAATFIAYNYNAPVDVKEFEREAKRILRELERECGWMYKTIHVPETYREKEKIIEELTRKLEDCETVEEVRALVNTPIHEADPRIGWGTINYTVWSDVFICPNCMNEVVFWDVAVDKEEGKVQKDFRCPSCQQWLSKQPANPRNEAKKPPESRRPIAVKVERAWVTRFDSALGKTIKQAKQVPVLINYTFFNKRYEKRPDAFDLAHIDKIESFDIPHWFPTEKLPEGEKTGEPIRVGITHIHHFFTKKILWFLSFYKYWCKSKLWLISQSVITRLLSKTTGYQLKKRGNVPISGTLYIPSLIAEANVLKAFIGKIKKFMSLFTILNKERLSILETATSSVLFQFPADTLDYIFTDPPFGENIMYSELNFLWEAWLRVFTNNVPEAIVNIVQGKGLAEYQHLMMECFKEYYRVLKPGRWMTVVFHNSKNSVWIAIQEALQTAGFIIADVRTLNKQQGSFNQITQAGAVKQDIIISCYKPSQTFEEEFRLISGTEEGVWQFVREHLKQLPIFIEKDGSIEAVAERQAYMLYDRMVAFHVQRNIAVPVSAGDFYAGLAQRFPERDGMYFLPEQVLEYDRKRMSSRNVIQPQLFITDEKSAIQWLRNELSRKPQTFQEIHPNFTRELQAWSRYERPLELQELLEENFLCYRGQGPIPAQIVSWMKQSSHLREIIEEELEKGQAFMDNQGLHTHHPELIRRAKDRWYVPDPRRAIDLEKVRERALLREFKEYKAFRGKRLRVFRLEALRAGFKKAWHEKDYETIIAVAKKIPDKVLQEDPLLIMWYDQALMLSGK